MPRIPSYDQNKTRFREGRNMIRIAPPITAPMARMEDTTPINETIRAITLQRDYDVYRRKNIIVLVRKVRQVEANNPFGDVNIQPGAVNFARGEMGIDPARRRDITNLALQQMEGGILGGNATTANNGVATELNLQTLEEARRAIMQDHGMDIQRRMDAEMFHRMYMGGNPAPFMGRPENPDPLIVLEPYPKTIELGDHKATLLDDGGKLYDESDKLRHCIFRSYGHRISAGDYIAYHIEGPGMGKNGATCGIVKHKPEPLSYVTRREIFRSKRKIKKEALWRHDQTRGKGNSIPDMDKAMPFIDYIVDLCNEHMPEEVKKGD